MKRQISIIIALALLFCLSSCAKDKTDNTLSTENQSQSQINTTTSAEVNLPVSDSENLTNTTTSYDFYESEEESYEICSEPISLLFPSKWKNNVKVSLSEDEAVSKVSFVAVFDTVEIPLYNFIFGSTGEGYLLGTVRTDKGEVDVYVEDMSSLYDGQLAEEYEITYYDMCEGLNDIISYLVYNNGMVIAG